MSANPSPQAARDTKSPGLPQQNQIRRFLRRAGIVILAIGVLCLVVSMISFFSAFGGYGQPRFFWLGFVGLPLIFVGAVMCSYGFMGEVARFIAGETAPVAVAATNYVAEETQGAVKTVAKAAAEGVVEGIQSAQRQQPSEGKD